MKICSIDKHQKELVISIDFWEAESMGLDVKTNRDVVGTYYSDLLKRIDDIVALNLGRDFNYGIKAYRDDKKGCFYYVITTYEQRITELLLEDMIRKHYVYDSDTGVLFHF